ncbi:IclR family transcriptional regulator C-terminal domain-containing protein [Mycolicibacterium fortuitum]|nr:IclR family transcriptional regulator C-terminal domain-containing protein [Mycolicibacterium fortuitum]
MLAFSDQKVIARVSANLRPATSLSVSSAAQLDRDLAAIRRCGVAYDRQESQPGLTCIAAPIRSWSGAIVAAVSISGPVHRFRPADAAPAVRTAAAGIARHVQEAAWRRATR